ncbi:MAG: GIY-YIG nuclease family protein [Bacteroidia bacterium]|nr:GIY-YIG nuclease family protein [Bacteroidia bacterium]
MKPLGTHNYFVYITTNINKKVLYTGVSNNLKRRLFEHKEAAVNGENHFTSKYKVFYLVYWERFSYIYQAIEREKQIKGWRRSKKIELITSFNPEWKFLNGEVE